MQIKYSNKIKETISPELINELFMLTYTCIPYAKEHYFTFDIGNEFYINHIVPETNYFSKIYLSRFAPILIPTEPIVVFAYSDCLYMIFQSEL